MASTAIKNRLWVARVLDITAECFRGIMQIVAAATVVLLLVYVVDYQVWRLPVWVRLICWAIVATIATRVALKEMVGPLRESRSDDQLALRVENKYRVLRGRLIATVQLTRHMDKWYKQGVALLVEAVKNQTEEMIRPFKFYKITEAKPVVRSASTLGAIIFGIGMLSIWQSEELKVYLERVLLLRDTQYPSIYKPAEVFPGWIEGQNPKVVIRGDSVLFTIRFKGPHPPGAKLEMVSTYKDGEVEKKRVIPIAMEMMEDNKGPYFAATVARVTEGFQYRFAAKSGSIEEAVIDKDPKGRLMEIIALVRPVVTPNLTIQYPTYTGKNPLRVDGGNAEALQGSRITLDVGCTKKIQSINFIYMTGVKAGADVPKEERILPMTVVGQTASLDLPPINGSFRYTVQVTDHEGAKNFESIENPAEPPPTYSIRALPDKRPRVGILDPKGESTVVREEAQYLVTAAADDDFGVLSVSLYWRVQRAEEQAVAAEEWTVEPIYTCGAQTPPTALNRLVIPIMPRQKLAKPGDSIIFFIEARDHTAPTTVLPNVDEKNLPEGIGRSKQYSLVVIDEETFKRMLAAQYSETIKALEEIRRKNEKISEKIGQATTNIYTPKRLEDLFKQAQREEAQNNLARALNIYQTIEEKAPVGHELKRQAAQRIRIVETMLQEQRNQN